MDKIAFVFESFARAGSQRNCVEILKGIKLFRPDIEVALFLISPINSEVSTFIPEVKLAGVPVVRCPYIFNRHEGASLPARVHNWISRRWREKALNRRLYEELSVCNTIICFQPFVLDLLLPNIGENQKICFHVSEHIAQRKQPLGNRILANKRLKHVFQHQSQITQLEFKIDFNKSIIWPLRLCADHLRDPLKATAERSGVLRIAHYSRISPMRFIDRIIDAFSLLQQSTSAELRIAGFIEDLEYYQRLLAQAERLGLSDQIHFVDPVPSPAEDPDRSSVDLVWMISLSGHIGFAGIESMAAAMPTLLLEVDSSASASPPDPELASLICATPQELVDLTLRVQSEPHLVREEQRQLVSRRFVTTKEAIDELASFYLGQQ